MGKLDEFKGAAQIGASFGAGGSTPAGMDLGRATTMPARLQGVAKDKDAALIPVDRIDRDPGQPREEFEPGALERLAESLRTRGQLQPIRVRWDEGRGVYLVVMGERRWRAARMAGLPTLRCVVMDAPAGPEELLALQLVENALREDLRPVEQAKAYRRLMEANAWSASEVARQLAVDQSVVSRALSLLGLPREVQEQVDSGALATRAAAEIARLDDPATQSVVAEAVVSQGLTRDEAVSLARAVRANRPAPAPRPEPLTLEAGGPKVTIRWPKGSEGVGAEKALRNALKALQARGRDDAAA